MVEEKDEIEKNTWETMKKGIDETAAHSKKYWGFECLSGSRTFAQDIGTKVYFVVGDVVRKGLICSINHDSTCEIREISGMKDSIMHIHSTKLYNYPRYALKEAKYNINSKEIEKQYNGSVEYPILDT